MNLLDAALRCAAMRDWVAVSHCLLVLGANPYGVDEEGRTAFNHAASNGLKALAVLTQAAFVDTQKARKRRRWIGYGLNTPSGVYGSTLITYAAKVCDVATVRAMIAAGADIRIVNGSGWSLLHCAAVMPGRADVIKSLLRAFEEQGYGYLISVRTTRIYETSYGAHKVTYTEGLSAAGLCRARLEQDPASPEDLKEYSSYLTE
ncbi:MAG: ankyrin repeat domain-containing protein [Micavibrio aeruginosavorus]|uniref:Ankyrin repeat domain-containing protein n=1 Tax=Micavibrio aeruginosavorus TaxID=349221 RepID=A0A7T5R0T7_9BACT|nr:MAG: ankyrin repeat domain-containing protein [Micavibrio aeruginosavorus]